MREGKGQDGDRIIHIIGDSTHVSFSGLVMTRGAGFRATGLTWGNLSSHMRRLEAAGYVEIPKHFVNKKPNTIARLTTRGRAAVKDDSRTMQAALKQVKT